MNDIFTFGSGTLYATHGGNTFSCVIDTSKMTAIRTDTTKALRFDLNSCLASMGFGTLSPGDSVIFVGDFMVNSQGPFIYTFEKSS